MNLWIHFKPIGINVPGPGCYIFVIDENGEDIWIKIKKPPAVPALAS